MRVKFLPSSILSVIFLGFVAAQSPPAAVTPAVSIRRTASDQSGPSYSKGGGTSVSAAPSLPDRDAATVGTGFAPEPAALFQSGRANVALASSGATATASSSLDANRPPLAAINGDRRGVHWGSDPATGSGWHCATRDAFPDWLEVTLAEPTDIDEIHLFTTQDNFLSPSEPTEAMTFTKYGAQGFTVQYWDGGAWRAVPGGAVADNNKIWRKFTFPPLVTGKLRVTVTGALGGHSRIVEVEAYQALAPARRVNHALAANGATAAASSVFSADRLPVAAINGDRKGLQWGTGDPATVSGWTDATGGAFPDWLEVTFAGPKSISEVSVISLQDNYAAAVEPTEEMAFTLYGLTAFQVQYWSGSAWAAVPGGSVTGNDKVWRRFAFPAVTTTKIRVLVNGALSGHSRIVEVEAYGPGTASAGSHSLSLDGVGSYVSVPGSPSLNIVGPITVEAWVRRNAGTHQAIVERYGAADGGYALRIESDRLCFYTLQDADDYDRLESNSAVTAGVWHHVAAVFDGKEKQIFIDGLLDTSAATTFGPRTGAAGLRIGASGGAGGHYFGGLIDEVRVTAGARYARSFTPDRAQGADRSDTRGLWKFDAQTAHDSSGKNNHGAFVGGAYCSTACPAAEKAPSQWVTTQTADQPIKIDFDLYAHGTAITTQYTPAVFSSGPNQLPVAYNPRLNPNEFATAVSAPNVLTRANNFWPGGWNHTAPLTVEFTRPVNNLRFWIAAIDAFWGNHVFDVDIYQNGVYKATWGIGSLGYGVNMFVNVGYPNNQAFGINEVTKIVIKNIDDPWGLEFDDFTFNAPEALKLDLTNPRVGGSIQGTVQKALLGADVRLQAVPNRGGGTYSWSVAGPHQRVSTSADQTATLLRWTGTGTYRVTATYALNGETASSSVDVNVIAPTLSSFTANQSSDRITDDSECFAFGPSFGTVYYMLGCRTPPSVPENPKNILGITFSATAQIPAAQYLSDPAQSGVKIVQIISSYNKAMAFGSTVCITARGPESGVQSGWQLDLADPYTQSTVHRFSENATLTTQTDDSPATLMRVKSPNEFFNFAKMDALTVDDSFETYVVYFTGSNPSAPIFQRALGFSNPTNDPNKQVAYLPWGMAGDVYFDPPPQFFPNCSQYNDAHCLQSRTSSGARVASSRACTTATCMTPYAGRFQDTAAGGWRECAGGPAPAGRMIDTARYFVWRHFKDFLRRDPFDPARPDEAGLDFWRGEITQCGYDSACVERKRVDVARAFFYADEFIRTVPLLADGSRCTLSYNKEFVRQCYYRYLQRAKDPEVDDPAGFNFWVSKLNNQCPTMGDGAYNEMLRAFILSIEYRDRFPPPPALPW